MKATEKKYAIGRIDEIAAIKEQEIMTATTTPAVTLSDDQLLDLVCEGKVTLLDRKEIKYRSYGHPDITAMYDFSRFESEAQTDEDRQNMLLLALRTHVVGVKDEIMLGDEEKAMTAIAAFNDLNVESDLDKS